MHGRQLEVQDVGGHLSQVRFLQIPSHTLNHFQKPGLRSKYWHDQQMTFLDSHDNQVFDATVMSSTGLKLCNILDLFLVPVLLYPGRFCEPAPLCSTSSHYRRWETFGHRLPWPPKRGQRLRGHSRGPIRSFLAGEQGTQQGSVIIWCKICSFFIHFRLLMQRHRNMRFFIAIISDIMSRHEIHILTVKRFDITFFITVLHIND